MLRVAGVVTQPPEFDPRTLFQVSFLPEGKTTFWCTVGKTQQDVVDALRGMADTIEAGNARRILAYVCPRCGRASSHPMDIANRYCGNCHAWENDPRLTDQH